MAQKSARFAFLWVLAIAGACVGYWLYQSHLSSTFKHVLVAACVDPQKEIDEDRVLEKAKAAVRTGKDREVFGHFRQLVEMRKDVNEYDRHIWDRLDADLTDVELAVPTPYHHLLALRGEYMEKHMSVPASLDAQIARAAQQQQEDSRRRHEQANIDKERTDRERAEIPMLYNRVRAELGMSPLPIEQE